MTHVFLPSDDGESEWEEGGFFFIISTLPLCTFSDKVEEKVMMMIVDSSLSLKKKNPRDLAIICWEDHPD